MAELRLPYGKSYLQCELPPGYPVEIIAPHDTPAAPDPAGEVMRALEAPLGGIELADFRHLHSAAIAVNDKTRPVPHKHLLPPLLSRLEDLGLKKDQITLIIATGTHPPMKPDEFRKVLPGDILKSYPVVSHDSDDETQLVNTGQTRRGTVGYANRRFLEADLRIVIGNIEPHQFQGFSGGVKSAAIGLAGRRTINQNHLLMTDPQAQLGVYEGNPAREDVEELGQLIGVHFALNAILNSKKEIVYALSGSPQAVMAAGIPLARDICQVPVLKRGFDLVIASAGGHPKDINLYQAQKALAHAGRIAKEGAQMILCAACPEGTGSRRYEEWIKNYTSQEHVLDEFPRQGFQVGPHKAWQIARDAVRLHLQFVSTMNPDFVRSLLLEPASDLLTAVETALIKLPAGARIAVMPYANATIPAL